MAVNLHAAFQLATMAARVMKKQPQGGVIINITSLGAMLGFPNNPAYVASKGGLRQLTKAMAYDLSRYNIRVNNICPGYMRTDMTRKSYQDQEIKAERDRRIMLGRWGKPEDLVGPCIFLASEASSYITGIDLPVDGGWLAKGL
jgi:NAD(P)-dependent dehydrogenase (short-subunit alcohol dehydrogenase family)